MDDALAQINRKSKIQNLKSLAVIASLILGLLAAPLAAEAQQPGKIVRVGLLAGGSPASMAPYVDALREGLRELGYVEGRNLAIEARYAEGKAERVAELAAELVRLKVHVIVSGAISAIRTAKDATSTIPLVMAAVADPLESEIVGSLARPGGNITGVSALAVGYSAKWLELLKEASPKTSRVAVLRSPSNPSHAGYWREMQAAGPVLGVTVQPFDVRAPDEYTTAFVAMTKERAGALIVLPDPLTLVHQTQIVDLAAKHRLPAMYWQREFVERGGLMAYGANLRDIFRRAATFVDKILKGAKPGDLPVEQAVRVELMINLKTAKALGLIFPQSILVRADQIIQ